MEKYIGIFSYRWVTIVQTTFKKLEWQTLVDFKNNNISGTCDVYYIELVGSDLSHHLPQLKSNWTSFGAEN